jgi:hypothetical protein
MLKRTDHRPLFAHVWAKDPHGFYIEPEWCSRRLFRAERFNGIIKDPACGVGRITAAARIAGYSVIATDLVDRGYSQFDGVEDFLRSEHRVDNIVCNPPYHICRAFAEHALKLARRKVAMIWLARRTLVSEHPSCPRLSDEPAAEHAAGARHPCWRRARRRQARFCLADFFPWPSGATKVALALS